MGLRTESIEDIKNEITLLEQDLRVLRSIIARYERPIRQAETSPPEPVPTQASLTVTPNMGLRDVLRSVLSLKGDGMRPVEVANTALELGYKYSGNTRFNQLVSSELSRMAKSKQLSRADGKYSLSNNLFD